MLAMAHSVIGDQLRPCRVTMARSAYSGASAAMGTGTRAALLASPCTNASGQTITVSVDKASACSRCRSSHSSASGTGVPLGSPATWPRLCRSTWGTRTLPMP